MDKILNLHRVNFKNQMKVLIYLMKRILSINNDNFEGVYLYYNYLIKLDGVMISENIDSFVTKFNKIKNQNILLRKLPSSDMAVLDQVILHKGYLTVVERYKSNFTNYNNLKIIDAGANIGLTTLFFKQYFHDSFVICLEPDLSNFKILEYNLMSSNFTNIVTIKGAIWSENNNVEIVKDFRDQLDWSNRVKVSDCENSVKAYSINQLIDNYQIDIIDILKIDIEGSEKVVFTSEKSNLNFLIQTRLIAIEIHKEFNCEEQILSVLDYYGFEIQKAGELTIGINKNLI